MMRPVRVDDSIHPPLVESAFPRPTTCAPFDSQRYYRTLFREVKQLSEYRIYDDKDDKVKKGKGLLSSSMNRMEFWSRLNICLCNFSPQDNALTKFMSSQIRALTTMTEADEILKRLHMIAMQILMANLPVARTKSSVSSRMFATPTQSVNTSSLSERDARQTADRMIAPVKAVLTGVSERTELATTQSNAIEKLLNGADLSENDTQDIAYAVSVQSHNGPSCSHSVSEGHPHLQPLYPNVASHHTFIAVPVSASSCSHGPSPRISAPLPEKHSSWKPISADDHSMNDSTPDPLLMQSFSLPPKKQTNVPSPGKLKISPKPVSRTRSVIGKKTHRYEL